MRTRCFGEKWTDFETQRKYVSDNHGYTASVMTEGELKAVPGGKRALREWRAGDESTRVRLQDLWSYHCNCEDIRMMAEKHLDKRAIDVMSRGFPKIEMREYRRGGLGPTLSELLTARRS